MKKLPFISIALCLLTTQLRAQVVAATARELSLISRGVRKSVQKGNPLYIPGKTRVGNTGLYSFQVTHILRRRVAKSLKQAHQTRRALPPNARNHLLDPVIRMENLTPHIDPFIKSVPYLHTSEQARLYLTARANRLYVKETKRLYQQILPRWKENVSRLRSEADTHIPENLPAFLAQAIPAGVNTINFGEVHGFKNITQFIALVLTAIRKARPEQEIFILTEFMPKNREFRGSALAKLDKERSVIWQAASDNNIRIVGLEPKEVILDYCSANAELGNYAHFIADYPKGETGWLPFFSSAEGIKWRNESFAKTIQEYQAKHPDAFFIVYTGDAHVNPYFPFATTLLSDPTKTFVISFRPTRKQTEKNFKEQYPSSKFVEEENRFLWDPLGDTINDTESFDQPFLYWKDPHLARIAGANIYIQVEDWLVKPEK